MADVREGNGKYGFLSEDGLVVKVRMKAHSPRSYI
jgi:hypothetical protein